MKAPKGTPVRITEQESDRNTEQEEDIGQLHFKNLRKPLVYFLMTLLCAGCLYLIFRPDDHKRLNESRGLNSSIPQAADGSLPSDKQKAYEQQLVDQKSEEKRNTLTSLSDYWNDSGAGLGSPSGEAGSAGGLNTLNTYRQAQQTLGSFYSRDDQESDHLKREITRLKNEVSQKEAAPKALGIDDQLKLMERSYQMAARYLPVSPADKQAEVKESTEAKPLRDKRLITPVKPDERAIVSSLFRSSFDSILSSGMVRNSFIGLQNREAGSSLYEMVNIRAVIHETGMVGNGSIVPVKLTEPMLLGTIRIPAGTVLKAFCKLQGGRLYLGISSIEHKGVISPVEINIHDNDGQAGLTVSYSPEQTALRDIMGAMGQNTGTSIMMTQSAGQQVAADLTRGVVQGISGYFQKKITVPRVGINSGHQVFLVSGKL